MRLKTKILASTIHFMLFNAVYYIAFQLEAVESVDLNNPVIMSIVSVLLTATVLAYLVFDVTKYAMKSSRSNPWLPWC